jgi:hypothetical protein
MSKSERDLRMEGLEHKAAHLMRKRAGLVLTSSDRQLFRENILMQCHLADRKGVPFHRIALKVRDDGYRATDDEVDAEIRYLEGKNYIEEVKRGMSPENRRYVSTTEGTDYLRSERLLE